MTAAALEQEDEFLPESQEAWESALESVFEGESEFGLAGEAEAPEHFLGGLMGMLPKVAGMAARLIGGLGGGDSEQEMFGELGGAHEQETLLHELGELGELGEFGELGELGEQGELGEFGEFGELGEFGEYGAAHEFGEYEYHAEANLHTDALMAHLGARAAQAETEAEAAEHFFPLIGLAAAKLLPLAAKALPFVAKVGLKAGAKAAKMLPHLLRTVSRVAPTLIRNGSRVARLFSRNPRTRALLRIMPNVVNSTMGAIAREAGRGRAVTPQRANRIFAQQTQRLLSNPRWCTQAYRRSVRLNRRFLDGLNISINITRR